MTTSHTAAAFTSAADVECLQCGAVSRAGTRFCTTCGAALRALACQTCAAINPYPAVFCAECGNPLDVALSKTGKTAGRRAFDATTAETVEAAAGAQWGVSAASPTDEELAPSLPGFLGWVKRAFGTPGTPEYRIMNLAMMVLIYFSVASIMLESVAEIHNAYAPLFEAAELVIVVAFTLEYAANIYAAPNKRAYILSFWGIIDLLAIIPSYLHLLDLRVLRITRSVR
ncbi:MAG: ion transporter, partial [Chloroflexi bacterium]|nr:ion transporter [Chloroflexota bacterium]